MMSSCLPASAAVGLKVGGNYTRLLTDKGKGAFGITFGLSLEKSVFDRFAFGAEFNLTSRISRLENAKILFYPGNVISRYDIKCSFVFFEIPVLLKYYRPINQKLNLFLYAGPSISHGLSDNSKAEALPDDSNGDDRKYDYAQFEDASFLWAETAFVSFLGFNLGAGVKWAEHSIELRYFHSKFQNVDMGGFLLALEEDYDTFQLLVGIAL